MSEFLVLMFLFFLGCTGGWVLELFFRRFVSNRKTKKWVNPGFLNGPYLPLYGFGLCILYLLAGLERYSLIESLFWNRVLLFFVMAAAMTLIEYIAGVIFIRGMKVKLWDYSNEPFNYKGIICLRFSLIWAALSAVYYFLIHPRILNALKWFSENLAFSFVLGMFFGVFLIDLCYSIHLVSKIRAFAAENHILVRYEELKESIRQSAEERKEKIRFLFAFRSSVPLREHLKKYAELQQALAGNLKENLKEKLKQKKSR